MSLGLVLWAAVVTDCADEVSNLGDQSAPRPAKELINALATNLLRVGVAKSEVERYVKLPPTIDGDAARLGSRGQLHFFGLSTFEQDRIELIQIWAFDKSPRHLATIFIETKPTNHQPIHIWDDEEYLYVALHRYYPEMLEWMISRNVFKRWPPHLLAKNSFLVDELLDEDRRSRLESGNDIPNWKQVFWQIASGYELERRNLWRDHFASDRIVPPAHLSENAKKAAVPNPPNREPLRARFDGWLAWDHNALAILGFDSMGAFRGWSISLHPKLRNLYHPAFPNLEQRTNLEEKFELRWLRRDKLIFVEIDWPGQHYVIGNSQNQVLLFESENDLPRGIPFYRIDPTTGLRLTERPEYIEPTELDKAASREALEKVMTEDPLGR